MDKRKLGEPEIRLDRKGANKEECEKRIPYGGQVIVPYNPALGRVVGGIEVPSLTIF